MRMKLELIPLPVSDVDRAIAFYGDKLGFKKDFDVRPREGRPGRPADNQRARVVRSVLGQGWMCTPENPAVSEACTWWWRTSPRRVPSLFGAAWRSARSTTSGVECEVRTSQTLTATRLSCRRWRGARGRTSRRPPTPQLA